MTTIAVYEFNEQSIRIRKEDRYVSLTDMANASGKFFADWKKLKTTLSYLESLSRCLDIDLNKLLEINESTGDNSTRGTWGHPKVAIRFAQWCSDEFAVQVDIWIDQLMTTGIVHLNDSYGVKPQVNPEELSLLRLGLTSVSTQLVDGFILNELGKVKPELKDHINEAHKLLAATTQIPEVLLTPTLIGKELGISSIRVNKLLTSKGYQIKNQNKSKGSPDYLPTDIGKRYAELTMATGKVNDNTTYQHLKWKKSVVEMLREEL